MQALEKLFDKVFGSSVREINIKIGSVKTPFIEIENLEVKSYNED